MRIALIDPFYDTSHAHRAEGLKQHSVHDIEIYNSKPNHWKWHMVGGTMEMANRMGQKVEKFDLLIATDMLDLPCYLGMLSKYLIPPILLYFHENQITYPWSPDDQDVEQRRDHHYGFMNFRSAVIADAVVFNSEYHRSSFLEALPAFCAQFPKNSLSQNIPELKQKSTVLGIGIKANAPTKDDIEQERPVFLWNHRWEYDKGADLFFETLFALQREGFDFGVIVLGMSYGRQPAIFEHARKKLKDQIVHWGYAQSRAEYLSLISIANIVLVTAIQDFFGIGVVEAIMSGCFPILPYRLAYPEHVPPDLYYNVFYRTDAEILDLTRSVITKKRYQKTRVFQDYTEKYHWNRLAPKYDALFENTRS